MLIGVPVGLGIAVFLTELCPLPLAPADRHRDRTARRHPLDHLRHLGRLLFASVHAGLYPAVAHRTLGNDPLIGVLFSGPPLGYGLLTAGLVLAVMILPFVTAISRDVFETVPPVLEGGGLRRSA